MKAQQLGPVGFVFRSAPHEVRGPQRYALEPDMSPTAVIFDMDGVIIDSHGIAQELLIATAKKWGAALTPDELKSFGALSSRQFWALVKQKCNLPESVDFYVGQYDDREEVSRYSEIGAVDGVIALLESLHAVGVPVGLATSAGRYRTSAVLDMFDLWRYFKAVVCDEDVAGAKPDPEIYLLAAEQLGVPPSRCVVIEDSENGLKAARSAGMRCIGYSGSPYTDEDLSGADLVVDDFKQISAEDILNV